MYNKGENCSLAPLFHFQAAPFRYLLGGIIRATFTHSLHHENIQFFFSRNAVINSKDLWMILLSFMRLPKP